MCGKMKDTLIRFRTEENHLFLIMKLLIVIIIIYGHHLLILWCAIMMTNFIRISTRSKFLYGGHSTQKQKVKAVVYLRFIPLLKRY